MGETVDLLRRSDEANELNRRKPGVGRRYAETASRGKTNSLNECKVWQNPARNTKSAAAKAALLLFLSLPLVYQPAMGTCNMIFKTICRAESKTCKKNRHSGGLTGFPRNQSLPEPGVRISVAELPNLFDCPQIGLKRIAINRNGIGKLLKKT